MKNIDSKDIKAQIQDFLDAKLEEGKKQEAKETKKIGTQQTDDDISKQGNSNVVEDKGTEDK
jgi:hypothetical protein